MENSIISNLKKLENNNIHSVNVETDPRLQYKFQNSLKDKLSMERPFEVCPLLILNFKYILNPKPFVWRTLWWRWPSLTQKCY